jgi:hypothetical protein
MIESQLGLPYLLPSTARIVGLVLMALVVTVFTGGMAAAVSSFVVEELELLHATKREELNANAPSSFANFVIIFSSSF